jgi:putative transposase
MYFLTLCTRERRAGLHQAEVAGALRGEIAACERGGHWCVVAGVIMPDHLHLLAELTGEIALSRVVARLKAKTKAALLKSGLEWQGNFYEHRLRADDPRETVIRYIICNPQRAGLVRADELYVGAWMHPEVEQWFSSVSDEGRPFPEWLL